LSDFGIKVSQVGWDVETAGDSNIYFSSEYPWLKIGLTNIIILDSNGSITINHDFAYPPFSVAYNDNASDANGSYSSLIIGTSSSLTVVFNGMPNTKIRYYIFRLPLNKSFISSTTHLLPVTQGTPDHNNGIKFAKEGKDITSNDLRDYTIHSGTKSPLIHKVIYEPLGILPDGNYQGIKGLEWINDLIYSPIYFAFIVKNNVFTPLNSIAQTIPKINFDGIDGGFIRGIVINDDNSTDEYGCFVILKDPLDGLLITNIVF